MDYFSFYDLPVSFQPDPARVKQQFYALSKKYHPDFYINESEQKQAEVLELSTLNNKAYQLLSDPQKRLHYILELKGMLAEGEQYNLPQEFLMEMMEVNEELMDLQFDPDAAKLAVIKGQVAEISLTLDSSLEILTSGFEEQDSAAQGETLKRVKDIYFRKKYLTRINDSIAKLGAVG
ncbi:Fe-S protein assembly co-chaperone HscB [Pedobacter antarcticus]|uniref:Fe-S protein assembly co-chaperone HscB n=1 Tax=Pedobacter antarcticus TaxID=34086 RepID=UPI001C56D0C5|nr:Fe-S protein assembly co-chaperone HscB [Pedobacter antarcticus]